MAEAAQMDAAAGGLLMAEIAEALVNIAVLAVFALCAVTVVLHFITR